jgi:uncharacterized protein (TIGR00251 family)
MATAPVLPPWQAVPGGLVISVRLTPKGGRDAIDGVEQRADGKAVLKARVRAAPHEGAANDALVALLAHVLTVAPRDVSIVGGAIARIKRVKIAGDPARLASMLAKALALAKAAPLG